MKQVLEIIQNFTSKESNNLSKKKWMVFMLRNTSQLLVFFIFNTPINKKIIRLIER